MIRMRPYIIAGALALGTLGWLGAALSQPLAPAESPPGSALAPVADAGPSAGAPSATPAPGGAPGAVNPEPADPEDPAGITRALYEALRRGEYLPAAGLVMVLLVWLLRRVLGRWIDWFKGKLGGAVLAFTVALLLSLGTSLAAGEGVDLELISVALSAAWVAAGGWEHVRDVMGWAKAKKTAASNPPAEPPVSG